MARRLARRRPVRRHARLPHRHRPRHDPLARVGHRRLQPEHAVRPSSPSSSSPATCCRTPTLDQKIASGFNRNHMINFEGGAIPEEYHTAYIVDRVNTTGTVWLGLTVGCTQCHDHKYDPITQKEYLPALRLLQQRPRERPRRQQGQRRARSSRSRRPSSRPSSTACDPRSRPLEAQLARPDRRTVDAAQAAWEKDAGRPRPQWKPLELDRADVGGQGDPHDATTTGRSSRTGRIPPTETYTFTFARLAGLTAIRAGGAARRPLNAQGPGPVGERQLRADRTCG